MKNYIKEHLEPFLFGFTASTIIWQLMRIISDTLVKLTIVLTAGG